VKRFIGFVVVLVLTGLSATGRACIMKRISEEEARGRADLTMIAELVEARSPSDRGGMRSQDFVVRVKRVILGEASVDEFLTISLTNLRARINEDGSVDCFEMNGSGQEENYRAGQAHLWMLSTGEGDPVVLWSRPEIQDGPAKPISLD
jgi:hypothetical protein